MRTLERAFESRSLEQGLKWHDVGFPPETAEFIEGRKFQLEEIARIFRIPQSSDPKCFTSCGGNAGLSNMCSSAASSSE